MSLARWALATLAAYRLYRLLALDDLPGLTDGRERLEDWIDRHAGNRWAMGLTCSWCIGFWACVATFTALDLYGVSIALPVVQIAAASTVVGLIGSRVDG